MQCEIMWRPLKLPFLYAVNSPLAFPTRAFSHCCLPAIAVPWAGHSGLCTWPQMLHLQPLACSASAWVSHSSQLCHLGGLLPSKTKSYLSPYVCCSGISLSLHTAHEQPQLPLAQACNTAIDCCTVLVQLWASCHACPPCLKNRALCCSWRATPPTVPKALLLLLWEKWNVSRSGDS